MPKNLPWIVLGAFLILSTTWIPFLRSFRIEPLGPLIGILFVVFSLFGDLPKNISWTQKIGNKLIKGITLGTILLLLPLLTATPIRESSFFAFSPSVWGAYISIVLVGFAFASSSLPARIYNFCKKSSTPVYIFIPLFILIAGLLGNLLDGVSIVTIATVILLYSLPFKWAVKSIFALLFGSLISNLITVAGEPTNIKFQDSLRHILNQVHPAFWLTNWPISIIGILFPCLWLGWQLYRHKVKWQVYDQTELRVIRREMNSQGKKDMYLALGSMILLAGGVILHSISESSARIPTLPLWLVLLPAGIVAIVYILLTNASQEAKEHLKGQLPIWGKLMIIFSLLWYLSHAITSPNVFHTFFTLPSSLQFIFLLLLCLISPFVDNVALAAMQGSLISLHPIPIWQIRLVFFLFTIGGGFTTFGCLQSLAINSHLEFSLKRWLKETPVWAGLALLGGLIGLGVIFWLYPTTVGLP